MKRKPICLAIVALAAVWLAVGCGGKEQSNTARLLENEPDNPDLVSNLTGINDSSRVPDEPDQAEEKPAPETTAPAAEQPTADDDNIGGSQGAFLGTMKINGEVVKGTFTVMTATASPEIVQKDVATGTEIKLDPGSYDFVFKTETMAGSPEFPLRGVEIPAGRRVKREVKLPTGQLTLVTGAKCSKRPIKLRQKGATEWYQGKFFTCEKLILLAGEYEAEMGEGKGGTPISGIQVYDGGLREVLIRPK